jgi:signal transduction histidine kinase
VKMFKSKLLLLTSIATLIVSVLGSFLVQRQILSSTAQQLTNAVSTDLRTGFYWKVTETLTPLAGGQFQQIYWERTSSIQHSLSLLPNRSVATIRSAGSLTIKLQDANKTIGRLTFDYDTLPGLFGGLVIWLIQMSVLLLFAFQRSNSERLRERLKVDAAIARTTQMLAHDVRKPFALFRMTLDRVKSAGSSELVQQALQEALPEVERSLANVDGLISDVLNVGGEFNLVLKPVWLAPVVEDVVDELRKLHPTRTLNVQISIPPDLWVEADDTRLPRVFLNILSNAIEAVETKEVELWISASGGEQMPKGGHVDIRVGNLGSFIAPEARSKLFDLFYTSGKKGGTGLGLAIVRKIIEAHGSSVVCSSERSEACPQGKVEFVWKLARAASEFPSSPLVSAVSSENSTASSENSRHIITTEVNDASIPLADAPAPAALPNVVFLDDSPLARWVWEAKLKAKAKVISFASPGDFWKAVENNALELGSLHTIITDHYFAPEEKITGVEFAAQLRQRGFMGRILLASNGEFEAEKLAGIVNKIVDKQPVDWELLNS